MSLKISRDTCGWHRKKGTVTGKKGQLTGKKGQFPAPPNRQETRASACFAGAPRARARKNKKKQEKNQQKSPLPKPSLWATLGAAGVPCTGHPCGVPPPLRGGSPSRKSWPPEGANWPPNTGLQPAPRALLDVGRAAPRPPCGCAPLRGLNGHAGTPLWLGNERGGAGMRRNGHRKP